MFGGHLVKLSVPNISCQVQFYIPLRTVVCLISRYEVAARQIPNSNPTNACSQVCGQEQLGCHAGHQEVSRCCTRGESQVSFAHRLQSMRARGSTPMLVHKYVDRNSLAAMLATKRSVGIASKVNLRFLLHTGYKACKPGDPTQL